MTSEQISGYDKKIKKDCIQYSLKWSPYILGEKFNVLKKLTEMTGLYVVFSLNKYKRLIPVILGASWYTGLRPTVLKIFTPTSVDVIPLSVTQKLEDQKLYIKYIEIYSLDDFLNIFFKLKEHYKEAFVDTNGLEAPAGLEFVKIVDDDTKTYHKKVTTSTK